ncbi:complex I subunit 5 family protein [Micrococcus endophyticus]
MTPAAAAALLPALVLVPLAGAAVTGVLPARARPAVALVAAVVTALLTVPVVAAVAGGTVLETHLGGFAPPLGIAVRADGLSAAFLALGAVVVPLVLASAALLRDATGGPAFWPLALGTWSGVTAVVVSGDLFHSYVGLELVSLCAVALVALGGPEAWSAALRYLVVAVTGSLLALVAVGVLVSVTGTLDVLQAGRAVLDDAGTHPAAVLALALASLGLALKTALFPLHGWLIPAHSSAPTAVSPLLSALVIKASLFVLLRLWVWVAGLPVVFSAESAASAALADGVAALAWVLAGLGVLALVLGGIAALRADRLKPLVAYSTVAQVGYWTLMLPVLVAPGIGPDAVGLTGDSRADVLSGALAGVVLLALGHGVAKAGLFLAAGQLKQERGTDLLRDLHGAARKRPLLVLSMALCAVGLAGMPLSLGFSGKVLLAAEGVAAQHYWLLAVVLVSTLLSAAYLVRALGPLLLVSPDDDGDTPAPGVARPGARPAPGGRVRAAELVPGLLGTLTIATGFAGAWAAGLVEVGLPW